MNDGEKFRLRLALETEVASTRERIRALRDVTNPVSPDNAIGRVSRMDAISNKSVNDKVLENARQDLMQLEKALESLNDPDFGKCERCWQPIGIDRLMAVPGVSMCMRCAADT